MHRLSITVRRLGIGLAGLLLVGSLAAAPDPAWRALTLGNALKAGERTWAKLDQPPASLGCREVFMYALALCEARTNLHRLDRLFDTAAQMQDRDPQSRSYGNFRWYWGNEGVFDYNAVDFCMQTASLIWQQHRDILPASARAKLQAISELALEGLRRHRVNEQYTNIALMNAANLILLGECLERPEMAREGANRLDRFLACMWESGTHEYNSPTYYGVDLEDLLILEAFTQNDRVRQQARVLLEYFWTDIAANWFAPARKLGGTRSRDYDYLRGLGVLDQALLAAGWLTPADGVAPNNLLLTPGRWTPPVRLRELAEKQLPRLVQQIWGLDPEQGRTHFVCADVSLSSSGAGYGGKMDLPLCVDLPGDRQQTRCYFIPDGRGDPYGKIKVAETKAHAKTLHLNPFWAAVQSRDEALGLVVYRDKDGAFTNETLATHWVMPANVDECWVGDQIVKAAPGIKATYPVPAHQPVIIRLGSALVGIRIPWAVTSRGEPASASLVLDGNAFNAMRLTIPHHTGTTGRTVNVVGAALWVRIGSQLTTPVARGAWRQAFAKSTATASLTTNHIDIQAVGSAGHLVVASQVPWEHPTRQTPAYPRYRLAIDGVDQGAKLLQAIEPVRSYAQKPASDFRLTLRGKSQYWEAESGRLFPPMSAGQDPKAVGGWYVWMPAEPGERASSMTGSLAWQLEGVTPGAYYLWGRVQSPTPENDSFLVRISQEGKPVLESTTWALGTHKEWTWVRFNPAGTRIPAPLSLPGGTMELQIKVREAGARLDRLYLCRELESVPPP